MKRVIVFVVFFLILGFALAGLYWSQRRPKSAPVSANAILNMAADAQRDLSRIPMHFTRLSDEQEIGIGKELLLATQSKRASLLPGKRASKSMSRASETRWPFTLIAACRTPLPFSPITT